MIASRFNLDHRLAELLPTDRAGLRSLRDAARPSGRPAPSIGATLRSLYRELTAGRSATRLAAR